MGALFVSSGLISDVMPCTDLALFLMSGAFLRISSLPFWLYPLKYVSHFYYGMDALSNIYWRQIDYIGNVIILILIFYKIDKLAGRLAGDLKVTNCKHFCIANNTVLQIFVPLLPYRYGLRFWVSQLT